MILVIGKENCSRCNMVQGVLNNKSIEYQYKKIEDINEEDKNVYLHMAKEAKQSSFPIIIKDNKVITLQEV
jgi:glutaredoxin